MVLNIRHRWVSVAVGLFSSSRRFTNKTFQIVQLGYDLAILHDEAEFFLLKISAHKVCASRLALGLMES
jgi:hypothetical protein